MALVPASESYTAIATSGPLCAVCTIQPPKYTCPRCAARTCSLTCSIEHKSSGSGCSGVRNRAAYISMSHYNYMALMNDYTYLEDVGRKVAGWGREIVQGAYHSSGASIEGKPRDKGKRGKWGVQGQDKDKTQTASKRELLRAALESLDIEVDFLPVGMEKRTLNQSTWDPADKTALMTVEFVFHHPPDPYAAQASEPPVRFLTHRNRLNDTIAQCIRSRVVDRTRSKKEKEAFHWLHDLTAPDPIDPDAFCPPLCVLLTRFDLSPRPGRFNHLQTYHTTQRGYYKLSYEDTLEVALRRKQFVEYPTIEVWDKETFTGTFVDDAGEAILDEMDERGPKRRKLGTKEGRKAISGLLDGYGSGDESKEERSVLDLLVGYAGSDGEVDPGEEGGISQGGGDEGAGTDDELAEEASPEELAAMLEQLRQAGALRELDGHFGDIRADEDQVDWGESEGEAM